MPCTPNVVVAMDSPVPPQPPADHLQPTTVRVELARAEVRPVAGIFQEAYQLTEAEFMAVTNPSTFWVGLGSVLCTFAVGYGLQKVDELMKTRTPLAAADFMSTGVILLLGLVCFGVSGVLSGSRRVVMKRLKQFFKDHPPQPEVR